MNERPAQSLLQVTGLVKHFAARESFFGRKKGRRGARPKTVRALDGVTLELNRAETLAIVGESGSGKTTLGRCISRLIEPDFGKVSFDGQDLLALKGGELRRWRRRLQMIFQDPLGSLDPRQRVASAVGEPIRAHRLRPRNLIDQRVEELLDRVSLDPGLGSRFPHELSGGQRQRVAIARALAAEPDLIIADEPVAALDVSVRAQVINLLSDLQSELGLAMLFIAHDLSLVQQMRCQVAVMYQGRFVEVGPAQAVLSTPAHPYTIQLVDSVPRLQPQRSRRTTPTAGVFQGSLTGCRYAPRCPIAAEECVQDQPELVSIGNDHHSACYLPQVASTLHRNKGNLSRSPT